jgi:HlyD family secretion protein
MRKWTVRLVVLAVLAAAFFAARLTVLAPKPLAVHVFEVERGRVESTVTNSKAGTVKARRRAMLSPEIGGIVVEIGAHMGDHVEAGDVLVRMDDRSLRAQLELAQAGLETARAQHTQTCISSDRARRELERNRELAKKQILSQDLLDQLESSYDLAMATCTTAEAEVERAKAQVRAAETELAKSVIHAPFAGVVADMAVEVGEWVTAAPPLMTVPGVVDLIDMASLYVAAPMDEVDSGVIAVGQAAKITFDPFPGRTFAGRVVRVAPYVLDVESQNRTVEIEVELEPGQIDDPLLPGTSADVEVVLDVKDGVLRVPTTTLMEGGRVLVVQDGVLVERKVEIGLRNWDWVEVRSGLDAGERVVSSLDRVEVKAGAKVVVEPAAGRS